jgi:SAM-dependent methyltransferase
VGPTDALRTRAQGYGELAWVNDVEWFSALLPGEVLADATGVLDLGCGPARLGWWLQGEAALPYVGVDRNPVMLGQAKGRGEVPTVLGGDLETLTLPRFQGWTFVLANVLHYLRDLSSLRSLPSRLGRPRLLCLAQTESPDEATLAWAQQLFAIVQPGYRRLWHKAGDLDDCPRLLGAEVVLDRVVRQTVDLDAWLDGWKACGATRQAARQHFDHAPEQVKAEGGGRLMVRRQRILHLRF